MISYKLHFNKKIVPNEHLDPLSDEGKQAILRRHLNSCIFHKGDTVRIKGTSIFAEVVNVEHDFNKVNWTKNRPHFIEIVTDAGVSSMSVPSSLKLIFSEE